MVSFLVKRIVMKTILFPRILLRSRNKRNIARLIFVLTGFTVVIAVLKTLYSGPYKESQLYGNKNYRIQHLEPKEQVVIHDLSYLTDENNDIDDKRIKHLLPYYNKKKNRHDYGQDHIAHQHVVEPYQLEGDQSLRRRMCNIYDLSQVAHLTTKEDCIEMDIQPPVTVCLYPILQDIHISYHIKQTGKWEPHIVDQYQEILRSNPSMGVIDIGANIGVYSLVGAHMGRPVVAVEPYIANIVHFHHAARLGHVTDKITLVKNAIFDKRQEFTLEIPSDNQGGVVLQDIADYDDCIENDCTTARTIYLDDLLEVISFKTAIMKIDIEGFEHRALRYSMRLFREVHIPYIIMEWLKLRSYYGTDMTISEDKTMTNNMVHTLHDMGYVAHSLVTGEKQHKNFWYGWPDDIIWKHKSVL